MVYLYHPARIARGKPTQETKEKTKLFAKLVREYVGGYPKNYIRRVRNGAGILLKGDVINLQCAKVVAERVKKSSYPRGELAEINKFGICLIYKDKETKKVKRISLTRDQWEVALWVNGTWWSNE